MFLDFCTTKKYKNILYFHFSIGRSFGKIFKNVKRIQLEKGILDKNGRALRYKIERDTIKYVLKIYSFLSLDNYLPKGVKLFQDEWSRILKSDLDYIIKKN